MLNVTILPHKVFGISFTNGYQWPGFFCAAIYNKDLDSSVSLGDFLVVCKCLHFEPHEPNYYWNQNWDGS